MKIPSEPGKFQVAICENGTQASTNQTEAQRRNHCHHVYSFVVFHIVDGRGLPSKGTKVTVVFKYLEA